MGLSLDGLASGLDTTALISALMSVERIPQDQLKARVATSQTITSNLQNLNKQYASLHELAAKMAKLGALDIFTANSSSEKVIATAAAGASAGELELVVAKIAQKHSAVSAAMTDWPDSPPTLTITKHDGSATEITAASTSLDDVVKAINDAGAGVSVMKVAAGTDSNGTQLFRLQFTSAETGAASEFDVRRGTAEDVSAGTTTSVFAATGAAVLRQGQDAEIKLYQGTAAEQTITGSTNEFKDLLPGFNVSVSGPPIEAVTVSVSRDSDAAAKMAEELVAAVKGILGFIGSKSSSTTTTDGNGNTKTTLGSFSSDSTIRSLKQRTLDAVTRPVDGKSPSEIGMTITKDGSVVFDAEKFKAALAKDPSLVESTVREIAGRVEAVAKNASDKFDGALTSKIKGQESSVRSLNDQITSWDRRLASRQAQLQSIYAALEVSMSNLQSQGNWLSSQLSAIPTTGSSS